jgi:LuxR family maltose regulon positive regulatory protein
MGESAAAEAATSERDVLLATKLNVPGLRSDLVPRPRLAQRLDEGRGRGLVLACAPAGYGKTVLLAEWVRRGRHRVAWLSLDAGDNDPARFWRHAAAALDRARPGISERMGSLLGPPAPPSFEPLVTALINEVVGQPDADEALLLVLDDYHVISSPLVHESLGFLLEHQPPGLQLALTSRSDPPLALARLRARGQLTELRAGELRFTPPEAAALLQEVAAGPGGARPGAPLPDAVASALAARTEGWAAQRSGSGFGAVAEVPLGCLARLQRALSTQGVAPEAGLVDPLTSRELEVLEMLAAGTSNQAIASQLVVTLDTVKKHVSHVLSKLGAANRTEAVARARELSLIP